MSSVTSFNDFGLSDEVYSAIAEMGYEEPTPIQVQTIPLCLEGKDVIGQAQTGTGKTAAFGIPIVERVDRSLRRVQAIILAPTRELALQVAEEMNKIGKFKKVVAVPIYGGVAIERQITAVKRGAHVVVGTPGRVLDHLERRTLDLSGVTIAVLDEADEMLDMGFMDDVTLILDHVTGEHQTLLFSATMPDPILRIARHYMKDPQDVRISLEHLTVEKTAQIFYEVEYFAKFETLCQLIDAEKPELTLIFCHTKRGVDELAGGLHSRGYNIEALHGDFTQAQRERVMAKFRKAEIEILVATDVAARGLDISDVSHVINYDVPQDPERYVHRIGRTGRMGKAGIAITFVTPREYMELKAIQALTKKAIQKAKLPSEEDVAKTRMEGLRDRVNSVAEANDVAPYVAMAKDLAEKLGPDRALAALLKLAYDSAYPGHEERVETGARGDRRGPVRPRAASEMDRLFFSVGRAERVEPRDIIRSITEATGVSASSIGKIDIYNKFAFVEVAKSVSPQVLSGMTQAIIRGKKVHVSPARAKKTS